MRLLALISLQCSKKCKCTRRGVYKVEAALLDAAASTRESAHYRGLFECTRRDAASAAQESNRNMIRSYTGDSWLYYNLCCYWAAVDCRSSTIQKTDNRLFERDLFHPGLGERSLRWASALKFLFLNIINKFQPLKH